MGRPRRPAFVLLILLAAVAAVAGLVAVGVLTVAAAARVGAGRWDEWADVGDAFGVLNGVLSGLAFAALVATLWVQFHELRLQRTELRLQRDAIERSGAELRRSADANLRMLHTDLIKMSLADPVLARVWPHPVPADDEDHRRQLLYANLIFQHQALTMLMADYTDEEIGEAMRYLFRSEIMREYWALSADARNRMDAGDGGADRIARIGDEVLGAPPPGPDPRPPHRERPAA